MDVIKLEAVLRETGKRQVKSIRNQGNVPCILYGHGEETVHFHVPEAALRPLIYTSETHRVEIEMNGNSWSCIIKDIDFDPVTDVPRHADFLILKAGETLVMTVPIHIEGKAKGQMEGGELVRALTELEVECLPKDIPSYIPVDVSALEIGDAIHVSDISVPGATILANPEQTIVSVVAPRVEEVEEVEEVELAEGELPEGEEAEETEGEEEDETEK